MKKSYLMFQRIVASSSFLTESIRVLNNSIHQVKADFEDDARVLENIHNNLS